MKASRKAREKTYLSPSPRRPVPAPVAGEQSTRSQSYWWTTWSVGELSKRAGKREGGKKHGEETRENSVDEPLGFRARNGAVRKRRSTHQGEQLGRGNRERSTQDFRRPKVWRSAMANDQGKNRGTNERKMRRRERWVALSGLRQTDSTVEKTLIRWGGRLSERIISATTTMGGDSVGINLSVLYCQP